MERRCDTVIPLLASELLDAHEWIVDVDARLGFADESVQGTIARLLCVLLGSRTDAKPIPSKR